MEEIRVRDLEEVKGIEERRRKKPPEKGGKEETRPISRQDKETFIRYPNTKPKPHCPNLLQHKESKRNKGTPTGGK